MEIGNGYPTTLSSPRAKRAGPKGLRAESARAVTGRRCPHSGVGEDFLERRPGSPHENGRNSGTKSRKLDPKVPKRSQRRGLRTKNGVQYEKTDFRAEIRIFRAKKNSLLDSNHVLATTGQSCQKKKVPFSQMNISLLANFGKKRIFGPFSAFRQNVKTAVSP